MNKLIQEFAQQADDYADSKIQQPGEYHPDWHDVRDQKFAQLVARRCVQVALDADDPILAVEMADIFGIES